MTYKQGVRGSNPCAPTEKNLDFMSRFFILYYGINSQSRAFYDKSKHKNVKKLSSELINIYKWSLSVYHSKHST